MSELERESLHRRVHVNGAGSIPERVRDLLVEMPKYGSSVIFKEAVPKGRRSAIAEIPPFIKSRRGQGVPGSGNGLAIP